MPESRDKEKRWQFGLISLAFWVGVISCSLALIRLAGTIDASFTVSIIIFVCGLATIGCAIGAPIGYFTGGRAGMETGGLVGIVLAVFFVLPMFLILVSASVR